MENEFAQDYRLRWMDFDRYGRIHPAVVLDIFQDVATFHANRIGIGRDDMLAKDAFWVVTRLKYEVHQEPGYGQVVTARTWPHSPSRFTTMRDYTLESADGTILIAATAEWVLLDVANRNLATVADKLNLPFDYSERRMFEKKPRKIKTPEPEGEPARICIPSFSDIDLNGHVNNARYAYFAFDAFHPAEGTSIRTFQIDYRQEALENEPLRLYTEEVDGQSIVYGINPRDAISFACSFELQ